MLAVTKTPGETRMCVNTKHVCER